MCRQMRISEAIFLRLEEEVRAEIRELRQLREERAKLKRLVADLSLDKHVLAELVRRKI